MGISGEGSRISGEGNTVSSGALRPQPKDWIASDGVLTMRPLTLEDSPLIVAWRNNPRVRCRYVYREEFTLEGQERYFHAKVESGKVAQFIFCEKETGRPIGCSVLDDLRPGESAEYGNWIGEDDAVGKGYNARIVRLTAEYAFRVLDLQYLVCRIFADNPASIRGCERAGFRVIEKLPAVECSDGSRADMLLLKMTAADMDGQTGRPDGCGRPGSGSDGPAYS